MTGQDFDDVLLDDTERLLNADVAGAIRAVASGGSQLRESRQLAAEAGVGDLSAGMPPRAVLVRAAEPSGALARVLCALAGPAAPAPIIVVRDGSLPRWAGPADLLLVASHASSDESTLSLVESAARRGVPMLGVGAHDSPLAELVVGRARCPYVGLPLREPPRASLWALLGPLLVGAARSGLIAVTDAELDATADMLDVVAERCRPGSETFVNPGKALATEMAESLPVIWGSAALAGVAARRLAGQLAGVARRQASWGTLPEAAVEFGGLLGDPPPAGAETADRAVASWEPGPWQPGGPGAWDPTSGEPGGTDPGTRRRAVLPDDFFADRAEEQPRHQTRLVLLRDEQGEDPVSRRSADLARQQAFDRGLRVSELPAEGHGPLERFASLCALGDFAAVYCGLGFGIDPTARRFGDW
ncbi:MAG: mannose-6-phosphate isomerase [Actinobacteria bacterium]|nr:mannose-6-phosphate isomerase [Actinomycetota bacterium]MBI3687840.1 mannose-6-phosphate isomerase [Actinomycetota bacterium]